MICVENVSKRFGKTVAVDEVTCTLPSGCVYGLVGSNGAGKSTLLRLMAGVYRPTAGQVTYNGTPLYNCAAAKRHTAFVGDDLYFVPGATLKRQALACAAVYPAFDMARFAAVCDRLGLDRKRPVSTFSKGVKRQGALALALCCGTDYLLLDETFDGLDPVVRREIKALLYDALCERGLTVMMASHSLRELEDISDHLALMHQGKLVLHCDADDMKREWCKIQVATAPDAVLNTDGLEIVRRSQQGTVTQLIIKGEYRQTSAVLAAQQPLLLEALPLSLEEAFVCQMEQCGYAFAEPPAEEGLHDA